MNIKYETPYPLPTTGLSSKTRQRLFPYSYIVETQDDVIYADEANGTAQNYSGVDASAVIQAAIDNRPLIDDLRVGKVFVKDSFLLSNTLKVTGPQYSTLFLEGGGPSIDVRYYAGGSVLKLKDNANCNIIENADDTNYRSLFLHNLTLDGNKSMNASGHGLVINPHLKVGDWQFMGLFNVSIQNNKQSGIYAPTYPVGFTGAGLNIGFNDEYGIYAPSGQGISLMGPAWIHENGKTGLYIMGGDSFIDNVHTEGNGGYGAYIYSYSHGFARIWSAANKWQGIIVGNLSDVQLSLYARANCIDLTGCPLSSYPSDIFITDLAERVNARITVDKLYANTGIDGLAIYSMLHSLILANIYSKRYALKVYNLAACADNRIFGTLEGETSPTNFNIPYDPSKIKLVDMVGYVTENSVLSPSFAIDGVALVTVTIPHLLDITPNTYDCALTVVENTNVDDWAYNLLKVDNVDATNVVAKINVSTASATGGATAYLALRVGNQ